MLHALAQTTTNCGVFQFGKCSGVSALIQAGVDTFFGLVWVIAIVFLAYGGIMFITSAGDKAKADLAQKSLTNALIGIVIILGVNVIVSLLTSLLSGGTTTLRPTIGASIPSL